MATGDGGQHDQASSHTTITRENGKDYCLLSERETLAEASVKHKKYGKLFSFSASIHDLKHSTMEKEKQVPSPTGVIEACLENLDSGSVSPESSQKELEVGGSRARSNWSRFFKLWKKKSLKHLASFTPLPTRKSRSARENPVLRDLFKFKSSLENFTLAQLQTASDNFSPENLIGKGGFSEVYKGRLQNGKLVAIKRLTKGTADEKTTGFLSELGVMAHVDHPNTAKLLGCGIDGGMYLVFELSPLGSLRSVLHASEVKLDWSKRYKIALGIAEGLLYLHRSCRKRIIHRDIKVDNILLTEDFEPQICDFGLAKWLPRHWTHHNVSKFEGTFGYFAPEYFMHGIVDEKTDIYAFGVLLLEVITGRPAVDHLQQSVVIWAKNLLNNNSIKELVDPSLGDNYDPEEMERVVLTASLCVEQSPILRPRMNQVVILLKGDEYAKEYANEGNKKALQRTYSEELLDVQEYNSTKYLNDMKRHRELALEC
ncbi:receptor-like cytosolic serine/threonine-protein kinase RBK2 isoform X2 [Hevea brasiliensis]|uniref:receptor-like cytosolic serine/threonine-protein kinase RBK2 isoform X2 n=1 Tax=Hevea brasiliensis TaxID=3981 RepID=UPI0025D6C07E|nr:receptor-like cytosolic serine/threonine-protein kinase RBK2 isoform X2 [Hevea brasiliensis]